MFSKAHRWKQIILVTGVSLVTIGLCLVLYFGAGAFNTYRDVRFVLMQRFNGSNSNAFVVRPWMSIKYVSSAYHVPEAYLFQQIGVPMTRQNSLLSFRLLSASGTGSTRSTPLFLDTVRASIERYRTLPSAPRSSGALLQNRPASSGTSSSQHE